MRRLLQLHQILATTVTAIIAFQKIDELFTNYKRRRDEEEEARKQARSKLIVVGE
jgi:hypothetical protein